MVYCVITTTNAEFYTVLQESCDTSIHYCNAMQYYPLLCETVIGNLEVHVYMQKFMPLFQYKDAGTTV